MSFIFATLTHPVTPVVWWALNDPWVQDTVAMSVGLEPVSLATDPARRLNSTVVDGWTETEEKSWLQRVTITTVASLAVPCIAWFIVAVVYKRSVTDQRPPWPTEVPPEVNMQSFGGEFKYGLCQCRDDCHYCLHACLLEGVRTSDTYASAGVGNYACLMCSFVITWLFSQGVNYGLQRIARSYINSDKPTQGPINANSNMGSFNTVSWYIAIFFLAVYLAVLRKKLRVKLGDANASSKLCLDFCTWWWCSCCVIVQEGRQVDEAMGVRVECCCRIIKNVPVMPVGGLNGGQVGAPVVVGVAVPARQ